MLQVLMLRKSRVNPLILRRDEQPEGNDGSWHGDHGAFVPPPVDSPEDSPILAPPPEPAPPAPTPAPAAPPPEPPSAAPPSSPRPEPPAAVKSVDKDKPFAVTLKKTPDNSRLGISVDASDRVSLLVATVDGGMMGAWNKANPE